MPTLYSPWMSMFYLTVCLYWKYYSPVDQTGLTAMLLKILPTLSLPIAIRLANKAPNSYQYLVSYGLLASVLGDAALVWDQLFVVGILWFGVAHFFYIKALNLKGTFLGRDKFRSLGLGVTLYGAAFFIWFFLLRSGLQDDNVLKIGVPLYIIWLTTSVWRAGCVGDKRMFWGAALFMFSDCCIGINLFSFTIPFAQVWIMSTYQVGQYLIAMSTFSPQSQLKGSFQGIQNQTRKNK